MDLSLKLAVPLTIALGGWLLGTINSSRQNEIAQANQKDAVIRDYIKEIKGMLLDKTVADKARTPGSDANGVARALTLTALTQLKGEGPERRSLVFQFLRESNFPILAGTKEKSGANLALYDLSRTNLIGANLRGASLIMADLSEANLSGAYLSGAYLSEANLIGAFLSRANLRGANLRGAYLRGANLRGADLRGAYIRGANLREADLSEADLREAYIREADLLGANLREANLESIQWDEQTKWPDRSNFVGAENIPEDLKKQLGL